MHLIPQNSYLSVQMKASKCNHRNIIFLCCSIAIFVSNFLFVSFMLHLFSMWVREFFWARGTDCLDAPSYALLRICHLACFFFHLLCFIYYKYSIRFDSICHCIHYQCNVWHESLYFSTSWFYKATSQHTKYANVCIKCSWFIFSTFSVERLNNSKKWKYLQE